MNKQNKVFLMSGAGVVAAVAITAGFLYYPPVNESDAQGAIGAVQKHHEQQIAPSDVVLGDEQDRKQEAALYGDLLTDSVALESMSAQLGSFAARLGAASFDQANMASFSEALASRSAASATESLGLVAHLQARPELQSFNAELAAIHRGLQARSELGVKELESFEQMLASMEQALAARHELQADSMMEAESQLQGISRQLQNREAALANDEVLAMAAQLGAMADNLGVSAQLESRINGNNMLGARLQQLQARVLEQRVLAASSRELQARNANALDNLSSQLAHRAAALEHRALGHMEARYEMRTLEAKMLENMAMMAASAKQGLEGRANLQGSNLQSLTAALANLDSSLQARQPMMAQRYMMGMQAELAAISSHMQAREQLGMREAANLGVQTAKLGVRQLESIEGANLESRGLSAQNLASFNRYLANLSASLQSRAFADNRHSSMLGVQAQQLQSRTAALQARFE